MYPSAIFIYVFDDVTPGCLDTTFLPTLSQHKVNPGCNGNWATDVYMASFISAMSASCSCKFDASISSAVH
jgi:hypothetical protein